MPVDTPRTVDYSARRKSITEEITTMSEAEWLTATDPGPMLEYLRDKVSDRKLRLFACACCRRIFHVLTDSRHAVELAEKYADGHATLAELESAQDEAELLWGDPQVSEDPALMHPFRGYSTVWPSGDDATEVTDFCVRMAAEAVAGSGGASGPERGAQSDLLRCIFGNPFRTAPAVDPAWFAGTGGVLQRLARVAYEERQLAEGTLDPARLTVLADALEDAGCTDPELLGHLREPGPHVRGCWALDLILSKDR
jgi:hypothetical protein